MDNTKPKVLIVDDNPVCRKQALAVAEKTCDCVDVESGEDAIEAFLDTFRKQEQQFNAILLDYEMPSMSGVDVVISIRKEEVKRKVTKKDQVKIIMTTSHNDMDIACACKSVGCNQYIIKPLTAEKLHDKFLLLNLIKEHFTYL